MIKFTDLNLDAKVLKAIADAGYETPTPIQEGAIPPALEGKDVLGIAQTGTGKTASFTLPMITLLGRGRARARMPRSLVLCPTRELAAQVAENFDTYTKYSKLTKALLIGGVSFKEQDKLIDRGVDVLIATPGRLLDHVERGKLLLTGVQIMVVDEADRMLDMGFIPDIERIFKLTPFTRQTLFFSATMAPEIERITNTFLSAPAKIEVARAASTSETITQSVIMFKASRKDREGTEKQALLRGMIESEAEKCTNAIIFCNRKMDVDVVAKSMQKHGLDASPIHGDLEQSKRMETLDNFRSGELRFLVASDVAARGLDVPNVSHVFNYDVPSHAEDYVHRIGRTGRAGKLGTAMMICTPRDDKNFADIERLVKMEVPRVGHAMAGNVTETVPAAEVSEKPTVKRTRGGRNKKPESKKLHPKLEVVPTPVHTQADQLVEAVKIQEPLAVEHPKQEREQSDNRRGGRGRGRDNNSNGNRNNHGLAILDEGMPNFISQSFIERLISEGKNPNAADDIPEGDEMPDPTSEIKDLAVEQTEDDIKTSGATEL
ncbi:MAG TPA: DEAD/DEAH box helicase [Rhodobacteraceae bacterium]|nr:DEAD/DEAH box helicase [Paracoccaceae bacterium]